MKKPNESVGSRIAVISIFSVIIILVALVVCISVAIVKKFSFRDIGVEYGDEEISSLDKKLDIEYGNEGVDGGKESDDGILDELRKQGKVLGVDYTIEYSEFEYKTIVLTASEATALINERMPSLAFLDNAQIKADENGYVEFSTGCDVEKTVEFLFPNTEVEIPESASKMANAYAKLKLTVENNVLYARECNVESGILSFLPVTLEQNMNVDVSNTLKNAPELSITDVHVTSDGEFSISGMLPTKASVKML